MKISRVLNNLPQIHPFTQSFFTVSLVLVNEVPYSQYSFVDSGREIHLTVKGNIESDKLDQSVTTDLVLFITVRLKQVG